MDVKQIRDEIAKIDSLLIQVEDDLKTVNQTESVESSSMESEYLTLLSSLSSAVPFASLMTDEDNLPVPDAFTFFGLIQAFLDDEIVLKCLCQIFPKIQNVTQTQLFDTLGMVSKNGSKFFLLQACYTRICRELISQNWTNPEILVESVRLLRENNLYDLNVLFDVLPISGNWSLSVQLELASFISVTAPNHEYIVLIEKLLTPALPPDWSVRMIWQLLQIGHFPGEEPLVNLIETAIKQSNFRVTDLHYLAIQLANHEMGNKNVWTLLGEKFIGSVPIFEVPKTLAAFTKMGITIDGMFNNMVALKKRVHAITDLEELVELADHLILAGDKSAGSIVTKTLMERRDLYVPKMDEDISKCLPLLCKILLASVVASVDSGTVIPESIMLLRKYQNEISNFFNQEFVFLLFHILLPNQVPSSTCSSVEHHSIENRISRILDILGFVPGKPDSLLTVSSTVEGGLYLDFAFVKDQVGIVVENHAVTLISSGGKTRNVLRGVTALKTNVLSNRKGWKVIIVVPEMFPDDKSLTSLFSEPLKKVEINSVLTFNSMEGIALNISQKIKKLNITCISLVEISKFLFLILKYSIVVHKFSFQVRLTDQFLNLLFTDFISTYLVRNKHLVDIDVSRNSFSNEAVLKCFEAVNHVAASSGGIPPVHVHLGYDHESLIHDWGSSKLVVVKKYSGQEEEGNVISLIDS